MFVKAFSTAIIIGAALAAPQPAPEPIIEVLEVRQIISQVVNAASSLAGPATTFAAAVTSAVGGVSTTVSLPSNLSACTVPSSILSLIQNAPSPPADLISAIATITNPCVKPSFTGTLSSEYNSYSKAAVTWASSLSSWQADYRKNCPVASSLSLTKTAAVCSTATSSNGQAAASGAAGSGSSGSSGSSTNGTSNAAGLQHHAAAGVVAVAGFAGVLALL